MAKDKSFSVAGGLGFQGYNTKNYAGKATARTGTDTTAATRDQFYGGASTPKKPAANPGMVSLPGTATKMLKQKFSTKYTPGEYAAYRKALAAKKPAVAKPAAQVISNVTREKFSPVENSSVSRKPPATRFGTVTGKTTGTMVSGGGGYGGGGTRGGGSLSGSGSGSRTAGTSRTGGTRTNDPVRG